MKLVAALQLRSCPSRTNAAAQTEDWGWSVYSRCRWIRCEYCIDGGRGRPARVAPRTSTRCACFRYTLLPFVLDIPLQSCGFPIEFKVPSNSTVSHKVSPINANAVPGIQRLIIRCRLAACDKSFSREGLENPFSQRR